MATAPWFVISPNALLSVVGLLRGPDRTVPTPAQDWRTATVDVVIPAYREAENIAHCLVSVARQTHKPRNIIVVDDGSSDDTASRAEQTAQRLGMKIMVIRRQASIGKTPTLKRQAREFDADVEFILDGDTFLESPDYIARCVEELYKGVGIASACGRVLPMRLSDRRRLAETPEYAAVLAGKPYIDPKSSRTRLQLIWWGLTNIYRDCLYRYLQGFVFHGQMVFFGGITNPVGCAVAYRREYIKDLFARYEPHFGDNLTNSEDIFIGFALINQGYRNAQLTDVTARSEEPLATQLPRQISLWSSSFLQSCYYFDALVRSPFKAFARLHRRWHERHGEHGEHIREMRKIAEPYRQAFGEEVTRRYGRPLGWIIFMSAIEKIGFPTALIVMPLLRMWEPLLITVLAESLLSLMVLVVISKGERWKAFGKSLLVTPLRYALILTEIVTIGRFASDLWITRNRKWRK
ncbi:glycosyl transferase family 2 [Rhodanobacter sp. FW510-R12]|uniref:glycosyltransferase family 2 protein n=1 Tax=unclassified Rhodanobacter TaxID=2621553 RepID=UPI0007A9CA5E|nr:MULTISPECIES: glycosyltransferase family 2 protein [unclassified Rhodanobacter]KZC15465.1 glycosyl transferase family 2 [Rhodanobacter sp. FW104-R8]KZC27824.1 glycosyl transferase family 2 [Rhodanobacter sp. FW510-T8]KZC32011.1 glycosyl transferase family 2 [Rhodanobacter sp. FW510-R10]